jgi:hypothetical protein
MAQLTSDDWEVLLCGGELGNAVEALRRNAHEELKLDLAEVTARLMVERWFKGNDDPALTLKLAMGIAAGIESYVTVARQNEVRP